MRVLLVTGFGAFPGARENPSATLAQMIFRERRRLAPLGWRVKIAILPVIYDIAPIIEKSLQREKPAAVLALGLARRRKYIGVETRARNRVSTIKPDSSGRFSPALVLRHGEGRDAVRTSWPPHLWRRCLAACGLDSRLSQDAGDYVCNALYWSLLDNSAIPSLFLHIPEARVASPARLARAFCLCLPPVLRRL